MKKNRRVSTKSEITIAEYDAVLADVIGLLESARRGAARAVNAAMTASYWQIGRRIVEHEQRGELRARYGQHLLASLAADLTARYGRGFSRANLQQMRLFYLGWGICQTSSGKFAARTLCPVPADGPYGAKIAMRRERHFALQAPPGKSIQTPTPDCFPLPWSHYVRLLSVDNLLARAFYEAEALRGGWTVRQLDRQIDSLYYERIALSKNKAAMLTKGQKPVVGDVLAPEEEIKDPFVLEFLGLKDEYSETQLEEALIHHLETFLLELGDEFTFVGRQRRLRVGDQWFRVDLLFFHRRLKCLVVIDLKTGKFSHADAGQMHLYLNYATEHWTQPGENPPVGLILCTQKDAAVVRYALENLPNKVLAAEYKLGLPDEAMLVAEIERTRRLLEGRNRFTQTRNTK